MTNRLAAPLLALTLLAATACSEQQSPPDSPEPRLDSRFTQPGTELEFGQTAVVPVPDKEGVAELTIDSCLTFLLDPGMEPIDRITFSTDPDETYDLRDGNELSWPLGSTQ